MLQYGYGVAATTLHGTSGWSATAAFWVLALWVMFQAGAAALTAALRHHSAIAPSRAMLVGALLCAAGPLTLAHADTFALAVLGYSVLCGSGAGIGCATCASTVAKWYPEARGVRTGFVGGAFGYGAVPFIILFVAGLTRANHAAIFTLVGVAVLAVVASCGFFFRDPRWAGGHLTSIPNCGPVIFPTDSGDARRSLPHCCSRVARNWGWLFGLDSAGRTLRGVRRTQRVGRRRVLPAAGEPDGRLLRRAQRRAKLRPRLQRKAFRGLIGIGLPAFVVSSPHSWVCSSPRG